jgi:glycosyl transferase family 25
MKAAHPRVNFPSRIRPNKPGVDLPGETPIEVSVIHLPRAKARKKFFLSTNRLKGVNYVFMDGIDSARLDLHKMKQQGLIVAGTTFRTPGCGLTHRSLWLKAAKRNKPMVICEDDAVFRKDFSDQFRRCMNALPGNWHFLLLGYNFDSILDVEVIAGVEAFGGRFTNEKLGVSKLRHFQKAKLPVGIMPLLNAFGTPGYAISPSGAQFLLDHVFPLSNRQIKFCLRGDRLMTRTVDAIMNGLYSKMEAYVCLPPLLITPNVKSPAAKYVKIN